ncbi:MAG: 50S ribosomal protein L11 [Planctomycetes bacterium]|nr:50S ribosomal protein L11 [Planctomycetota bacterium]
MAKEVTGLIKLQVVGGKCTPAPPVGPALGQHGVNIGEFVKRFNDATGDRAGKLLPVEITVFSDRSFEFVVKQPPASALIKEALGIAKGSQRGATENVGNLSTEQLEELAKAKMPDLNTNDLEAAKNIIAGTARNMGVTVDA